MSLEPAAYLLSSGRVADDYQWFGDQLMQALQPYFSDQDPHFIEAWVSDGEEALLNGFQKCLLFDPAMSTHILCELHLKENDKQQLIKRGFSDQQIKKILIQIYGHESELPEFASKGRCRVDGLVDAKTNADFQREAEKLALDWDELESSNEVSKGRSGAVEMKWSQWFFKNRYEKLGALFLNFSIIGLKVNMSFSHRKSIFIISAAHYSAEKRRKAGYGLIPGRATNNEAENVNRRLLTAVKGIGGALLKWDEAIQKLREWTIKRCRDLEGAIISSGKIKINPSQTRRLP